jgi:hypothetical protein
MNEKNVDDIETEIIDNFVLNEDEKRGLITWG